MEVVAGWIHSETAAQSKWFRVKTVDMSERWPCNEMPRTRDRQGSFREALRARHAKVVSLAFLAALSELSCSLCEWGPAPEGGLSRLPHLTAAY